MSNQEAVKDENYFDLEKELETFVPEVDPPEDLLTDTTTESAEVVKDARYFSNEEDLKLIVLAKEQDPVSFEILFNKYSYLIRYKAKKYFAPGIDRDDLIQEGSIGLYNSIRDFKMEHPTPFRVFCELCIERQIITAVKTATRQKHQPLNKYVSFDKPVYEEESDRNLHDTIENKRQFTPEEIIIDRENIYELLTKLKDRLSPFESEVFECQMQRLSYQEIADHLGRHVKSIDNAMQRIREKVLKARDEINEEDFEGKYY
jgi:RNA polymerase sporulation-specific sigma factor